MTYSTFARPFAVAAPYLAVFVSNAAIMTIELVAGRLISPYLGMSLYTWTSIIGVVLAGMSLGNYAGGRLADRTRPALALAGLFALSSAACFSLLPLNRMAGELAALGALTWPLRILLHIALLFFLPAAVLGTISPVVVRWALSLRAHPGRIVGGVFAFGVLGSIAGTFFAGFYLVLMLGVTEIVVLSAGMLAALAVLCLASSRLSRKTLPAAPPLAPESVAARGTLREWLPPNATVFASNAAFMVLELAASRVLAREFGSSLYTWTTIIGVILAGIATGNYLGGRLADRRATRGVIAALFLLSSSATLAAPLVARSFLLWKSQSAWLLGMNWPLQITCYVVAVFLLPCFFIGFISPVVVKRTLDAGRAAGHTAGNIYAWGAVGSIAGAFAAGYFLIDWFGSIATIVLVALLLAAAAIGYHRVLGGIWTAAATVALLLALLPGAGAQRLGSVLALRTPAEERIVYEDESQYSYIAVRTDAKDPNLREFFLDKLVHSQVDITHAAALRYPYEWIYEAVTNVLYPSPAPVRAFIIGGGGYAFPHFLEVTRSGSHVEVAEIDPAVTEAAHAAFGLPRETAIEIHNMDARNRVADLVRLGGAQFDLIYGDSINDYTVPYHLTTLEFTQQVGALLTDEGAYLLNLIDVYQHGGFVSAVANTCSEVFPFVYVFSTRSSNRIRDTFVVVGSHRSLNMGAIAVGINQRYQGDVRAIPHLEVTDLIARHGRLMLTDNYAPVENLLLPVVRTREMGRISILYNIGVTYSSLGNYDKAIEYWETVTALAPDPEWDPNSVRAHEDSFYNLVLAYIRTQDYDGAWDTLKRMRAAGYTPGSDLVQYLQQQSGRPE
ncbi:MAG: fused MFS/spermidine synthase [Candidatus Hydrogenedentes bacterium]|nr:fused MFS/spermidine synthase [Candidatus Hydrogenedentota bacterium]